MNTQPIISEPVPGYEQLAAVLTRAYEQAARGKGKERHAQHGEAFERQVMGDMARRFGTGALLAQAFKKSEESQRLPAGRDVAELLGAIVYLAGAVIHIEAARSPTPVANDNTAYPSTGRCNGSSDGRCVHTSAPCVKGCSTRA